mmetsp:Transcript_35714/g.114270  ORF Transcript_35714/g.114270 Transcript_35714/m.114270 type:complete len:231 (-) Transcript_35714:2216-2908(-)
MATVEYDDDDDDADIDADIEDDDDHVDIGGDDGGRSGAKMASAMAKILASSSSGEGVLSKRKTPMMRALDERQASKKRKKATSAAAATATEPAKLNYERSLRKTATRAVVALFNAIAEHQRTDEATSYASEATSAYGEKVAAAREVQRKTQAAIHDLNAKDLDDDQELPNSWARDDYLLDAANGSWDDDDDDEESDGEKDKGATTRKDGKDHAFLYSSEKRKKGKKKPRV